MQPQNLHHFNVLVGEFDSVAAQVKEICRSVLNFECDGSQNFSLHKFDAFLIDDARIFAETKNRKIKQGEVSVSIITFGSATIEAQNALLKLFEEPVPGSFIFLIVSKIHILLPTILSRANLMSTEKNSTTDPRVTEIFKMSFKDRLEHVVDLVESVKKEKVTRAELRSLADNIMSELNTRMLAGKHDLAESMKHLQKITQYIDMPGASLKNILEYMMLLIPKSDIIGK